MAECCCPEPAITTRQTCPSCASRAVVVEVSTLKALLTPSALAQLRVGSFYFCGSPSCDTVYFSDGGQMFRIADVRVAVWQKQPAGARTLCYCFGENEADMLREIEASGRTLAVGRVREHVAGRRCACDVRNPRGVCCLGDLTAAAKRLSLSRTSVP